MTRDISVIQFDQIYIFTFLELQRSPPIAAFIEFYYSTLDTAVSTVVSVIVSATTS